jgi:hypothetical protein
LLYLWLEKPHSSCWDELRNNCINYVVRLGQTTSSSVSGSPSGLNSCGTGIIPTNDMERSTNFGWCANKLQTYETCDRTTQMKKRKTDYPIMPQLHVLSEIKIQIFIETFFLWNGRLINHRHYRSPQLYSLWECTVRFLKITLNIIQLSTLTCLCLIIGEVLEITNCLLSFDTTRTV